MSNTTNIFVSQLATSLLNNSTTKHCSERFSISRCFFTEYGRSFDFYFFLAFSLLPQVILLNIYHIRYVAGISYIWIIIRILALTALMLTHPFDWSSTLELLAIILTITIFLHIIGYSHNLQRKSKIILIIVSLSIWSIGRILIFFFVKQEHLLMIIGYLLFAVQMLPQILLNSLLRTAKAISKLSILLLAINDVLLFFSFPTDNPSFIYLISIYYSFSFLLFIYLQSLVYSDAHIHLISRSAHTVLTPGVDVFTGLDIDGVRSTGQVPQMFSIDDAESMDESDIVYQPVTTNKSSKLTNEETPINKFLWYTQLGCIFCIETIITIILVYRVGSPWIIFVPISILLILGIFFLLRTRLNVLHIETLRKIL